MSDDYRRQTDSERLMRRSQWLERHLAALRERSLASGGFAGVPGRAYRPDATAWAIVALESAGDFRELVAPARERLAREQLSDGRVPVDRNHPESFWPTPLAVMAWHGSSQHVGSRDRAVHFLLGMGGFQWEPQKDSPFGHDTSLVGWSWGDRCHSWVEPTAMAILALRLVGWSESQRVKEGVQLLLDRQISTGGWNYGNTVVFGQELRPTPASTGMALHALAGLADREQVRASLDYLHGAVRELRTPLSLAWVILGLGAWRERPTSAIEWVSQCFERQGRVGPYETSQASLLILASLADRGLYSLLK